MQETKKYHFMKSVFYNASMYFYIASAIRTKTEIIDIDCTLNNS